jgi:hypothetical protein
MELNFLFQNVLIHSATPMYPEGMVEYCGWSDRFEKREPGEAAPFYEWFRAHRTDEEAANQPARYHWYASRIDSKRD